MKFTPLILLLTLTSCVSQANLAVDSKPIKYQEPTVVNKKFSNQLSKSAVTTVANQVTDWQLSQFDLRSAQMRKENRASGLPEGWIYATFDIGLLAWAQSSSQPAYQQAAINLAKLNEWKVAPRTYHADDHAIASVYLDLYNLKGGKEKIAHIKSTFDQILKAPSEHDLAYTDDKIYKNLNGRLFEYSHCTARWCWADALFMAPPVWAQLTKVTGNQDYINFMDKEFWVTTDYLFNEDEQLFLRDSRYFTRKDSQGRFIYWGRGNGWVLAGIARTLAQMPKDFPSYGKYVALYKKMSKRLIELQLADGSWPSSLLEADEKSMPESSGTGLLVFALAWGVNNNILDKAATMPTISKGWSSLVDCLHSNGKLGYVQQIAFAPGTATQDDTQLYGTGALLLAASEVLALSY